MASVVNSFAITGIDGYVVTIETDTIFGKPSFAIVGLGDAAIREATQRIRFEKYNGVNCNAQITPALIAEFCKIDEQSKRLFKLAFDKFNYSARSFHKFLKIARTSADLEGENNINYSHVSKALMCREIDKEETTMAFLPCGIDYIYPKEHKPLIDAISKNGVLISQYPPGDTIKKSYFFERNNRLMEWSDKVILVEAPENSATLATVEYANQISKRVYALPSSIYSKEGQGTNNLIYSNKAEIFLPKLKSLKLNNSEKINVQLNEIQRKILLVLKNKEVYVEELKEELKLDESILLNELFSLEIMSKLQIKGGIVKKL